VWEVVAMRESGRESFETWARSRQQGLVRTAYLLTGDFHRAEDLVQEALVKAAVRWDTLASGNPDAWVRTVVYRDQVSWWRRHRREVLAPAREQAVPPADETMLVLREALLLLTARQRAVLVLRYVDDLSLNETAEVLGLTIGSIKKHASVALARLRVVAPELEELMEERR
jgi:RNA polymerase sigma-70 factor (sigma-E family)